jgi:hypothetical protein
MHAWVILIVLCLYLLCWLFYLYCNNVNVTVSSCFVSTENSNKICDWTT